MDKSSINIKMNSFASFDDAMDMCDLLARETGDKYSVVEDKYLGFTTNRDPRKFKRVNKKKFIKTHEFKQAWRGFSLNYLEIVFGLVFVLKPYKILSLAFYWMNIEEIPVWLNLMSIGDSLWFFGLLLVIYGMRFIYSYFSENLFIDEDGLILKKGIIAQSQVQIRFGDIKTIGVKQSILDRILGIGTVHLDSAGTNGTVDIEFKNIIDPVLMRRNIQVMIDKYINLHG